MKENTMKSYLKSVALFVAILVSAILHHIFTILGMALGLVKKAIGLLQYLFAQCIIKMVDLVSHYTQDKKPLNQNMGQNRNFYDKL
jgi:hypothetical protein